MVAYLFNMAMVEVWALAIDLTVTKFMEVKEITMAAEITVLDEVSEPVKVTEEVAKATIMGLAV